AVTGCRIGHAIAPAEPSSGIRRAADFVTVGAPHPLQEAAVPALGLPDSYYARLRAQYQARRDLLYGYVEAAGFVAWKPRGAYYILTDVAHFLKRYGVKDDTAFAMWLIETVGVATVLGCGKASGAMARAAEDVLGDRITESFVVVKDGYTAPLRRIRLAEAGHPVPDARGLAASARLLELAASAREDDLVVFLVSGGGS